MDYLKLAVSWIPSKKARHYLRTCLSNVDLKQELLSLGHFVKEGIRPNSVLVMEANTTHGEVVPGYVKYLCDMGYNVDVVLTPRVAAERPFERFKDEKLRFFVFSHFLLKLFFKLPQLRHYHKIIMTSSAYYFLGDGKNWPAVADVFGLQKFDKRLLVVEHDLLDVEKFNEEPLLQENRLITLSDFGRGMMVNPHYFGEFKSHPKK